MDEKKVREAIKEFEIEVQVFEDMISYCKYFEPKNDCGRYEEKIAMRKTAIEALEKQLPRKVEIKEWSPSVCPCCGYELSESVGDGFYKHPTFLERCPNPECGQRLEWGE